jgi:hypothetical protein
VNVADAVTAPESRRRDRLRGFTEVFTLGVDRFAALLVDELLAQPVAGLAVNLAEGNPLRR